MHHNECVAKIRRRIGEHKRVVADITDSAIQAFDQRDECQSKVAALDEKAGKDLLAFGSEMKELQRTLDHGQKLKTFLFSKSNDRAFAANLGSTSNVGGGGGKTKKEMEAAAAKADMIAECRRALMQIRRVAQQQVQSEQQGSRSSEVSLDRLVADFVRVEDQNFALFNYVTEMNNQVEALQESIGRLRSDINEARGRGEALQKENKRRVELIENKLETSKAEAISAENKLEAIDKRIKSLQQGTEKLFKATSTAQSPVLALIGQEDLKTTESQEPLVNERNVQMYLDLISQRVAELAAVLEFVVFQESRGTLSESATMPHLAAVAALAAVAKHPTSTATTTPSVSTTMPPVRRMTSSAQLLGRGDDDVLVVVETTSTKMDSGPFDLPTLKARAFVLAQHEHMRMGQKVSMSEKKLSFIDHAAKVKGSQRPK